MTFFMYIYFAPYRKRIPNNTAKHQDVPSLEDTRFLIRRRTHIKIWIMKLRITKYSIILK